MTSFSHSILVMPNWEMKESYKKIFKLTLLLIIVLNISYIFPPDDSLRHVGSAFGNNKSWGDTYPFSIFEEFKDYNPWLGHDLILRKIANALRHLPMSVLTLKFFLIKSISFLFSLIFFSLVLDRSGILNEVKDRHSFTLAIIVSVAILTYPFFRIMIARPFAFGTFFLIHSVGQKGIVRGFLSALFLAFYYPYLCWFYILPVAFTHYVKGDKKFALGAFSLIIIFFLIQPLSFWGFQIAIVNSDIIRSAINLRIEEFISIIKCFSFYLYLAGFILLFPHFDKNARRLNYENILILLYIFSSLKYNRYFYDIILPMLFISFGREIFYIISEPYQKFTSSFNTIIQALLKKIKTLINWRCEKSSTLRFDTKLKTGKSLKPYIFVTYLIICFLLIYINFKQIDSLKKFLDILKPIPKGSLVLTDLNLQYKIIFLRPDLRLIPSCELGFTRDSISKEYINFLNEGILSQISKKTGAKYFIESKDIYLNPQDGRFLKLLKKNRRFTVWSIEVPYNKNTD